ncbi:hypothetical protein Bpla01_51650 [Burkholderia plantarii]|nr:hypothetical protein Bpla01_51650 [Burkholderia plantarii]
MPGGGPDGSPDGSRESGEAPGSQANPGAPARVRAMSGSRRDRVGIVSRPYRARLEIAPGSPRKHVGTAPRASPPRHPSALLQTIHRAPGGLASAPRPPVMIADDVYSRAVFSI